MQTWNQTMAAYTPWFIMYKNKIQVMLHFNNKNKHKQTINFEFTERTAKNADWTDLEWSGFYK